MRLSFSTSLTLVILLVVTKASGQTYTYEQIANRADSIIKTSVGSHLLKYYHRDSTSIKYNFRRSHWRKFLSRHGEIRHGETTKGQFESVLIVYWFHHKEPIVNAALHKGFLTYSLDVNFGSNLNLINQLENQSFIPKYLREGRSCDFIPLDSAIMIAKKVEIKNGIGPLTATLDYDNGYLKRYCWWVTTPLTKEQHGNHVHGEADTVTIDAVTGEVVSHQLTYYGPLH